MIDSDVLVELAAAGLEVVDNRAEAPASYIRKPRASGDVKAVFLHQTGFSWKPDNPLWPKVRAHFVVMQDGELAMNFGPLTQMRYGSYHANPFSVTIEFEGNYPNAQGKWWKGEKFGEDELADHPAQVEAGRKLIDVLRKLFPTITHVYAHRQWEAKKANDPGPDLWKAIGRWSIERGLTQGGPGWHYKDGLAIPASWGETGEVPPADDSPPAGDDDDDETPPADAEGSGGAVILAGVGLAAVAATILLVTRRRSSPRSRRR